jgi:hypothetical protein
MMHEIGIHLRARHFLMRGEYIAECLTCGWNGEPRKTGAEAQTDALAHQGGTRHVRERVFRRKPPHEEMDEMFPEAR